MDLGAACPGHHVGDREAVDAPCREDLDTARRPSDQFGDPAGPIAGGFLLSAGHHPPEPQVDQLLQSRERVGGDVEGTVEDDLAPARLPHQQAATVGVHPAVGGRDAQDDAVGPVL